MVLLTGIRVSSPKPNTDDYPLHPTVAEDRHDSPICLLRLLHHIVRHMDSSSAQKRPECVASLLLYCTWWITYKLKHVFVEKRLANSCWGFSSQLYDDSSMVHLSPFVQRHCRIAYTNKHWINITVDTFCIPHDRRHPRLQWIARDQRASFLSMWYAAIVYRGWCLWCNLARMFHRYGSNITRILCFMTKSWLCSVDPSLPVTGADDSNELKVGEYAHLSRTRS